MTDTVKRSNIKRHYFLLVLALSQLAHGLILTTGWDIPLERLAALKWVSVEPQLLGAVYLVTALVSFAGVLVRLKAVERFAWSERLKPVTWYAFALAYFIHVSHGFVFLGAAIFNVAPGLLPAALPFFVIAGLAFFASGVVDLPDRVLTKEVPVVPPGD